MPEVPKKAIPEAKVPIAVPKKEEAPPAKGTESANPIPFYTLKGHNSSKLTITYFSFLSIRSLIGRKINK